MSTIVPAPQRDDLAAEYLDLLPYEPYPVQEEALLTWFTSEQGVLVCAPTGTGKTLIAEAAMYEALRTGTRAYYTTPLIALTEQKFAEMQEAAERWGFSSDDVGLVTGNRHVNPDATVLVVVAEILLNRLLHPTAFDFSDVSSVVMDEFHSFNDPERGIVWELSLALMPPHVRLLLLSATVGNSVDFLTWLRTQHSHKLMLVQSTERKVPLEFRWIGDELLSEHLSFISEGDDEQRKTPALIFCFNRSECWSVAEQLKGKSLLADGQQKRLADALAEEDWTTGAGPKLKQILMRGVGVHHAGLLPKFRRRVENLFQQKLLSVCICTETLAAGINLPARSVILTTLLKGPPGKKKLIDASSAHQMFGRAGRPQFDSQGYVFAMAHEDDVKILRWKEKYDQIPEDTKDPQLIKAKKALKKKKPTRRSNQQYWEEEQFQKLIAAPPGNLSSRGQLPWRLLAYLLLIAPEVHRLRAFVRKRMLDSNQKEHALKRLDGMLMTLWAGDYVTLEPEPPAKDEPVGEATESGEADDEDDAPEAAATTAFGAVLQEALAQPGQKTKSGGAGGDAKAAGSPSDEEPPYSPELAHPSERLKELFSFRSVNPLYGHFLAGHLAAADRAERIQALESVLEIPGSMLKDLRVPPPWDLPPGPLAREFLDEELLERGLVTAQQLDPPQDQSDVPFPDRVYPVEFAEKLHLLFQSEFPQVRDLHVRPVWAVGDLLHFGGDFNKYVTGRDLTKQEGVIFRHAMRMILLCGEFLDAIQSRPDCDNFRADLEEIAAQVTEACRRIDPTSTDKLLEESDEPDFAELDHIPRPEDFGAGLFEDEA